jgi:hypothetical protein
MSSRRMPLSEALTYIADLVGSEKEAWKVLRSCLRRGELESMADTWGPNERWNAVKQNGGPVLIPPKAWEYSSLDESRDSTVYWPSQWPVPGMVQHDDDYEFAHGVHLAREDVERIWPNLRRNAPDNPPESPRATRSPSGAPSMIDWKPVLIEAARYMYANRKAGTQAALFNHLRTFLDRSDGGPSDTTMKDNIGPLWRAFKAVDDR